METTRLRPFELFRDLNDQELSFIAKNCGELTVPSGTVFIRQGQVGREVFLLEEGSVGIYRGETEPARFSATVQAPTILGEMALLDPERIRTANVKALSDLRLVSIPIKTFLVFLQVFPSVKDKLRQLVATRR